MNTTNNRLTETTAEYNASIEAHNERVLASEWRGRVITTIIVYFVVPAIVTAMVAMGWL